MRSLTPAGVAEAKRRGLKVEMDVYGCLFACNADGEAVELE